jgi:acetylornithine deacetylase/succinyl-diaminopimelate desuccinylase-like protein
MNPEYQFKVEKLTDKEKIVDGLLSSGHIVSCEQKFGHYEISVYGKQTVSGKGGKPTDWFEKNTTPAIIKTPYYPPTTAYFGTGSITTTPGYTTTVMNCNVSEEADLEKIKDAITKAVEFGTREVME